MTRPGLNDAAMGRRVVPCLGILLVLNGACAAAPVPVEQPIKVVEHTKSTPVTRPTDASATYHFMLGYQAELAQNLEQALKEYQAALKADPTAQSVKARFASIYF